MRGKILLATKDRIAGDALQFILDKRGYSVQIKSKNLVHLDQQLKEVDAEIIIFGEMVVRILNDKLHRLKKINLKPKLAFILSAKTSDFVVKGLQKGVDGFIHKEHGLSDLINCLSALKEDCTYISPALSGRIVIDKQISNGIKNDIKLTSREEEIIHLVKENKTSREIGEILNLSTKTVQNHRQNICYKLGLKGRNKLYEYALARY